MKETKKNIKKMSQNKNKIAHFYCCRNTLSRCFRPCAGQQCSARSSQQKYLFYIYSLSILYLFYIYSNIYNTAKVHGALRLPGLGHLQPRHLLRGQPGTVRQRYNCCYNHNYSYNHNCNHNRSYNYNIH